MKEITECLQQDSTCEVQKQARLSDGAGSWESDDLWDGSVPGRQHGGGFWAPAGFLDQVTNHTGVVQCTLTYLFLWNLLLGYEVFLFKVEQPLSGQGSIRFPVACVLMPTCLQTS